MYPRRPGTSSLRQGVAEMGTEVSLGLRAHVCAKWHVEKKAEVFRMHSLRAKMGTLLSITHKRTDQTPLCGVIAEEPVV